MRFLFYVLPAVILIPAGIYFYYFFRRFLTIFHLDTRSRLSRVCSICFALACMLSGWKLFSIGAVMVLYFLGVCIVVEFLHILVRNIVKNDMFLHKWSYVYRSGILGFVFVLIMLSYGYYNMGHVVKQEYSVSTAKMQGQNSLRIVGISDLHMGTTMSLTELEEYCDKMEGTKPDIVVLLGDIFDEDTSREDMEAAAVLLGNIESKFGTYYIFGNHDYSTYRANPDYSVEELRNRMKDSNIRVLEDQAILVDNRFYVVGHRDASRKERLDTNDLIGSLDSTKFILLLDHQPGDLKANEKAGVDLQLSGHTHAGQIWPTGFLMELLGINQINYGHRIINDYQVIVSSGIGGWGYPIRTGGRCEYFVIDVES